jgi:phosphosulfolactate phosphohydrolase-like enzyme
MEIRVGGLIGSAATAAGTTVIIDAFSAFTTATVALLRVARRIVIVNDSLDKALDSIKPPGFDFGNSPAELGRADVAGKTLIQTTSNGTAGINAARGGDRICSGALVTVDALRDLEEREKAVIAHVEEVMAYTLIGWIAVIAGAGAKTWRHLHGMDERHTEHVDMEADRRLPIVGAEREVMNAAQSRCHQRTA